MSWRVWEKRLPIISSFFKITFFLSCKNSAKVLFQKILYCPKFTYFNYTGPARVRGNVKNMTRFSERAIMGWINETNLWIHVRENVLIRVLQSIFFQFSTGLLEIFILGVRIETPPFSTNLIVFMKALSQWFLVVMVKFCYTCGEEKLY